MSVCDICKASKRYAAHKEDERNQEPSLYLSACNYRSGEEYKQCTGE